MVQHSGQARRVVELARAEAEGFGHRYLGPEHLVLGILSQGDGGAGRVLEAFGVTLAGARAEMRRLVDSVGLPEGYRGAAGLLLAAPQVDLEQLRQAVALQLGGVRR